VNTSKPSLLRQRISRNSSTRVRKGLVICFVLSLMACVTVPPTNPCSVNGMLANGATCANTSSGVTTQLTMAQALEIIEAQPTEHPDPNPSASPGSTLPAHPAGVFESAHDWDADSVVLQEACRELGARCSYATQQVIARRATIRERSLQAPQP
jgi:hypothetical protein